MDISVIQTAPARSIARPGCRFSCHEDALRIGIGVIGDAIAIGDARVLVDDTLVNKWMTAAVGKLNPGQSSSYCDEPKFKRQSFPSAKKEPAKFQWEILTHFVASLLKRHSKKSMGGGVENSLQVKDSV